MSEVSHCATSSERMNVTGMLMTIARKTHHGNPSSSAALRLSCVPEAGHQLYFIVRYSATDRHASTNAKGASGRGGAVAAARGSCDAFTFTRSCAVSLSSRSSTSDATGPLLLAAAPPFLRQLMLRGIRGTWGRCCKQNLRVCSFCVVRPLAVNSVVYIHMEVSCNIPYMYICQTWSFAHGKPL